MIPFSPMMITHDERLVIAQQMVHGPNIMGEMELTDSEIGLLTRMYARMLIDLIASGNHKAEYRAVKDRVRAMIRSGTIDEEYFSHVCQEIGRGPSLSDLTLLDLMIDN